MHRRPPPLGGRGRGVSGIPFRPRQHDIKVCASGHRPNDRRTSSSSHGKAGRGAPQRPDHHPRARPPNIEAISIGWYDDVEESKKRSPPASSSVDQKNGVVIFTDMFGGTPSNLSFTFSEGRQRRDHHRGQPADADQVHAPLAAAEPAGARCAGKVRRAGPQEHPPGQRPDSWPEESST
ncbi:MAG: hypothetical protein MZW92_72620 [Comamonadaceae bacterium]|nr:hypothetical protein [Comamonadaceae bacterium]